MLAHGGGGVPSARAPPPPDERDGPSWVGGAAYAATVPTARRLALEYPEDLAAMWNPAFPEFSAAANGISLLMPFAEPYFVRSVRAALPELDPDLRASTADFLRQEVAHHRHHRRFNDLLVARYGGLARVEGWIERTYGWLETHRSLRFNVAFAAASETIAFCIARWSEDNLGRLFTGADPVASTLYLWHLAEEVEHKSSAFDVFEALDGSRLRYAAAMLTTTTILVWFVFLASLVQLHAEGRAHHPVVWFRLIRWSLSMAFSMLPTMAVSCLPGHHPDQLTDPVFLPRWLGRYDPATGTLPPLDEPAPDLPPAPTSRGTQPDDGC